MEVEEEVGRGAGLHHLTENGVLRPLLMEINDFVGMMTTEVGVEGEGGRTTGVTVVRPQ
jgi:hypothetical protein